MKRYNSIHIIVLTLVLIGAIRCTNSPQGLGGGSGTDVSAIVIIGTVVDTLNQPVAGCLVRLRPYDYITTQDVSDSIVKRDVYTAEDGRFVLDSVPFGASYTIECINADSQGYAVSYTIDSTDTFTIPTTAVIKPMARIIGNDLEKPYQSPRRSIHVRGLERTTDVDSAGNFELRVPSGECRLHLTGFDSLQTEIDTQIYVEPGEDKELFPHTQPPFPPCETIECEMGIVQNLLDSNQLTIPPDSIIVIENNHIVALKIGGLAVRYLPSSIGQLHYLKFLDIHHNFIDSLPATIGQLVNLVMLFADDNKLKSIPLELCTLPSLSRLNLAFNNLQSLPDALMNLSLTELYVSFNRLCDISIDLGLWIDQFDDNWKRTQKDCTTSDSISYSPPHYRSND